MDDEGNQIVVAGSNNLMFVYSKVMLNAVEYASDEEAKGAENTAAGKKLPQFEVTKTYLAPCLQTLLYFAPL